MRKRLWPVLSTTCRFAQLAAAAPATGKVRVATTSTALYCARSRGRRWWGKVGISFVGYRLLRRGADRSRERAQHVRSTLRADTMARIERHSALCALPPHAPLTPRTFDQERAPAQHRGVLAVLSILRLESKEPCDHRVFRPQHLGTRPSHTGGQSRGRAQGTRESQLVSMQGLPDFLYRGMLMPN